MMIVASVSLNYYKPEKLKKMLLSGADALRYSFGQGEIEDNVANIEAGIEIVDTLHSNTKIIVNLPSNKIKVGGDIEQTTIKEGEEILLKSPTGIINPELADKKSITIKTTNLGKKVYSGQIVTVDYGKIAFKIGDIINNDVIVVQALNNGVVRPSHTLNIAQDSDTDAYLNKIETILEKISGIGVDIISIPFINLEINKKIEVILTQKSLPVKKMIRIENQNGIDNIDEICENPMYSYIVINRGELGDNVHFEKLGIIQKELIRKIKKSGKPIIIASQILESAMDNFVPARSDISDLANMVIDGVDGIVFTNETALGDRPAYVISTAKKIILETQRTMR